MHITQHGWTVLTQIVTMIALVTAIYGGQKWLKKNFLEPLKAIQHFTTQNGNREENQGDPTIRDDLHTIKTAQAAQSEMIEQHLAWSTEETGRLWKAIGKKQDG